MNTAGIAVVVTGLVVSAVVLASTAVARMVVRDDYKVTFTGPSLRFEKRSTPLPRPPAPKVLILSGDGGADRMDRDYVVKEAGR